MMFQASPHQSPRTVPFRLLYNKRRFADSENVATSESNNEEEGRACNRKNETVWSRRNTSLVVKAGLLGFFLMANWVVLSRLRHPHHDYSPMPISTKEQWKKPSKSARIRKEPYERMLAMAAHALAENKREPKDLWHEPSLPSSPMRPCADHRQWKPIKGSNGYILVTANGGMNQQRVAICNAVTIARWLDATLVIPTFMHSSVWRDASQFRNLYQVEHFVNYLAPDVRIEKTLPDELQALDLEAIGSVVRDTDVVKEAKLRFYTKNVLPILRKNRVVHFVGFGNRLAFDPIPFQLQRLRCRCNFHALQFVPGIQQAGALLLQRLRDHAGPLDGHLVGSHSKPSMEETNSPAANSSRYLALHLRFEIDMVAHSLCDFGGGEEERQELEAYREIHFPALAIMAKAMKFPSPTLLRSEGLCPLTPEEAALVLAALGFSRQTQIFVAGANLYGGKSRLATLTSLYPNLVTKENLLSAAELQPFINFSSQLAALDFIGCSAGDAFAMTDSGSQFSSLVSGYRIFFGGGKMPTIRPNKRRLAAIFMKNSSIGWRVFEQRIRKVVRQSKHVMERPKGRSVYRYPHCKECMCL